MKTLLVNVSLRPESDKAIFPIGLAYIATAMKKAGFDFEIYDIDVLRPSEEEIEERFGRRDYDVVAMGCIVTGYKYIKKYCDWIKKYKDVPIIIGNSVATSIPRILMEKTKADIGVMGEGDVTIVELIKAIRDKTPLENIKGIFFKKNKEIIFTQPRKIIQDIDNFPFLDYDLFDMKHYIDKGKYLVPEPYPIEFEKIRPMPMNTARGCPFNCTFCYHVFKGEKFRFRSTKNIFREILYLKEKYGINYLMFSDELSLFSKQRAEELADFFIENDLNVFWDANCRAGLFKNTPEDLELIKKLKKSGCLYLGYSLESGDEEILKAMNKMMSVEDFIEQTRVLKKGGIVPLTSLVIGYPQETAETIKKTFDVCEQVGIYPSVGYLLPQQGTPMYNYALEHGLINDEEEFLMKMGDRQDFTINFTQMSQEEMERLVNERLKRLSEKLHIDLHEGNLIKTGHYVQEKIREENDKSDNSGNVTQEGLDERKLEESRINKDINKKKLDEVGDNKNNSIISDKDIIRDTNTEIEKSAYIIEDE